MVQKPNLLEAQPENKTGIKIDNHLNFMCLLPIGEQSLCYLQYVFSFVIHRQKIVSIFWSTLCVIFDFSLFCISRTDIRG